MSMESDDRFAIEVKDLACGYGETAVLEGISFSVKVGELFFIVGRNGSGKSTLLRSLVGLVEPLRGTVSYFGRPFTDGPGYARRDILRSIGVLYQSDALWSSMSLRENIEIPLEEHLRNAKEVSDGVKAVRRVVRREERGDVADVEREQIPHGVVVLRPIEATQHGASRIGHRRIVESSLEPGREPIERGTVGMRHARRWHRTCPQLANDLLPQVWICRQVLEVDRVEDDPRRSRGRIAIGTMARCAILLEEGAIALGVGRARWRRAAGCCGLGIGGLGRDASGKRDPDDDHAQESTATHTSTA